MSPFTFIPFHKETIDSFVSIRDKETKIGQNTEVNGLSNKVQYIILGIEEDMGPQANG